MPKIAKVQYALVKREENVGIFLLPTMMIYGLTGLYK
jgi:hypothetical protein